METSRSVIVGAFGSYDVIKIEEFSLPPLEDRVEVQVEYGGVNFADIYTRQGLMYDKKLPFVLGMECVGTITQIGAQNTNLKVGQKVICYDYHCGMFRDVVRVTPDKCYPIPDHINLQQAAAVFVNYLTAYFSIIELGNLKKNENILILSCGGGVGLAATQLAKNIEGVTVVGTTSREKHDKVKENGVDLVLSLDDNFPKAIQEMCPQKFDVILTNFSGPLYAFLETLLKPLGRIVIIGANNLIQNDRRLSFLTLLKGWWTTKDVKLQDLIVFNRAAAGLHLGTLIESDPEKVRVVLEKIFGLIRDEKLRICICAVYPMEEVAQATRLLAERKNLGKVLLQMKK